MQGFLIHHTLTQDSDCGEEGTKLLIRDCCSFAFASGRLLGTALGFETVAWGV